MEYKYCPECGKELVNGECINCKNGNNSTEELNKETLLKRNTYILVGFVASLIYVVFNLIYIVVGTVMHDSVYDSIMYIIALIAFFSIIIAFISTMIGLVLRKRYTKNYYLCSIVSLLISGYLIIIIVQKALTPVDLCGGDGTWDCSINEKIPE